MVQELHSSECCNAGWTSQSCNQWVATSYLNACTHQQNLCYKKNKIPCDTGWGKSTHQILLYKRHHLLMWADIQENVQEISQANVDTFSGHINSGTTQAMAWTLLYRRAGAKLHLSSTRVHTLIVKHQQANSRTHFNYNRPLWTMTNR